MPGSDAVLVAEDDPLLVALLRATFRGTDLRLLEATTGNEALAVARAERPDLVLLDLGLPGLDGHEVCRLLKGDPATAGIPVLMLTARTGPEDRQRAADVGADGYVTKPFSPRALVSTVRQWLAMP